MQLAITLFLVAIAAAYTFYELWRSIFPPRLQSRCGHACGGCSRMASDNEKGEPVTLVPLEVIQKT